MGIFFDYVLRHIYEIDNPDETLNSQTSHDLEDEESNPEAEIIAETGEGLTNSDKKTISPVKTTEIALRLVHELEALEKKVTQFSLEKESQKTQIKENDTAPKTAAGLFLLQSSQDKVAQKELALKKEFLTILTQLSQLENKGATSAIVLEALKERLPLLQQQLNIISIDSEFSISNSTPATTAAENNIVLQAMITPLIQQLTADIKRSEVAPSIATLEPQPLITIVQQPHLGPQPSPALLELEQPEIIKLFQKLTRPIYQQFEQLQALIAGQISSETETFYRQLSLQLLLMNEPLQLLKQTIEEDLAQTIQQYVGRNLSDHDFMHLKAAITADIEAQMATMNLEIMRLIATVEPTLIQPASMKQTPLIESDAIQKFANYLNSIVSLIPTLEQSSKVQPLEAELEQALAKRAELLVQATAVLSAQLEILEQALPMLTEHHPAESKDFETIIEMLKSVIKDLLSLNQHFDLGDLNDLSQVNTTIAVITATMTAIEPQLTKVNEIILNKLTKEKQLELLQIGLTTASNNQLSIEQLIPKLEVLQNKFVSFVSAAEAKQAVIMSELSTISPTGEMLAVKKLPAIQHSQEVFVSLSPHASATVITDKKVTSQADPDLLYQKLNYFAALPESYDVTQFKQDFLQLSQRNQLLITLIEKMSAKTSGSDFSESDFDALKQQCLEAYQQDSTASTFTKSFLDKLFDHVQHIPTELTLSAEIINQITPQLTELANSIIKTNASDDFDVFQQHIAPLLQEPYAINHLSEDSKKSKEAVNTIIAVLTENNVLPKEEAQAWLATQLVLQASKMFLQHACSKNQKTTQQEIELNRCLRAHQPKKIHEHQSHKAVVQIKSSVEAGQTKETYTLSALSFSQFKKKITELPDYQQQLQQAKANQTSLNGPIYYEASKDGYSRYLADFYAQHFLNCINATAEFYPNQHNSSFEFSLASNSLQVLRKTDPDLKDFQHHFKQALTSRCNELEEQADEVGKILLQSLKKRIDATAEIPTENGHKIKFIHLKVDAAKLAPLLANAPFRNPLHASAAIPKRS